MTGTAGRMTPEDAKERLAFYATFSDVVDQITHDVHDALAALLDPDEMLRAWERAGQVTRHHAGGAPPMTFGYEFWRIEEANGD